jgi:hypothetical protein
MASGTNTSVPTIEDCLSHIRYASAAELARTGRYLEAEDLLAPNDQLPDSARELDLLARMAAHQERFEDAARLWSAALKADPNNTSYKECLQQLSNIQADGQPLKSSNTPLLWWCLALCALVSVVALLFSTHRDTKENPRPTAAAAGTTAAGLPPPPERSIATNSATAPTIMPPVQTALAELLAGTAIQRVEQTLDQMLRTQRDEAQSLKSQLDAFQATNSLLLADLHAAQLRLDDLAQSITDLNRDEAAGRRAIEPARSELAGLLAAHFSAAASPTAFGGCRKRRRGIGKIG